MNFFVYRVMPEYVHFGSIGSSNSELSQFILRGDDLINEIIQSLSGHINITEADGTEKLVKVRDGYSDQVLLWMRKKMFEVLNKNMYLSQLSVADMYSEARYFSQNFATELFFYAKEFDLKTEQFEELKNVYYNFLSVAIRRALFESDKKFLGETHSESTQNVRQHVTETSDKKGLWGLFK